MPGPILLLNSDALLGTVSSRYRSFYNFIANALGAIAAYCFFEKKPAIEFEFVNDGQLHMF